ncbi:MAG: DUF2242 domain-containing protein [Caldimonas sp.]
MNECPSRTSPSDRARRPCGAARAAGPAGVALCCALLAGCATPRVAIEANEAFDSASTYTRTYAALDVEACEAARRTLLSQGYVIATATPEQVRGRKSFQPGPETHVEVEFNVVCAKEGYAGRRTIAFVNAVQDSYAVKKSNNSASVGVPALGSLSLPFIGSEESLVKVASSTITNARFYDRFFRLMERYLAGDPGQTMPPAARASEASPAVANGS